MKTQEDIKIDVINYLDTHGDVDDHNQMQMFDLDPGPQVGKILDHLMEQVLDNPSYNSVEKLKQLATDYHTQLRDNTNSINKEEAD